MRTRRILLIALLALLIPALAGAAYKNLPGRDLSDYLGDTSKRWLHGYIYNLHVDQYIELPEISAPSNPAANYGRLYVRDSGGGTTQLVFRDSAGTVTVLGAAGTQNTLDQSYDQGGAGSGRTINATDGAVVIQNTDADTTNILELNKSPSGGAAGSALSVTMGANATGAGIAIANSGSGNDVTGTGSTWSVTKAGVATFASANGLTGLNTTSGNLAIGSGANTLGINTSSWDISSGGAMSGFTSLSLSDDITLANGKAVKGSTTNAQTLKLQAYDVDNTTYRDALTLTNGNTIAMALGTGFETLAIDTSDWDISTTGDMTGIGAITMDGVLTINNAAPVLYPNEAITFTHATNGAGDDLTFDLTGATDSSIILQSAGTGEDTIKLNATAGGVDIDAAAAKDVNIAGGQVALASKDDAASAISLTANVGTTETIVVTNTQGTSESAITLNAAAGGVNVDAAAAKDLDLAGGQVKLVSKDDAAGAISLTANVGTSETIMVTNTQGTAAGAIALTATAGGVDIDAAAAKDVDIAGGQVLISSKDNGASAIALTTNTGANETIVITNTQGTNAAAINLTATAGGISMTGSRIAQNGIVNRGADSELTLDNNVGGAITITKSFHNVDTNADAATGDLATINGGSDGDILTLKPNNGGRTIVVKHATGNIQCGADFTMDNANDTITLIYDGSNWLKVSSADNGA